MKSYNSTLIFWASLVAQLVKNLPAMCPAELRSSGDNPGERGEEPGFFWAGLSVEKLSQTSSRLWKGCEGKNQMRTPIMALDHAVAFLVLHGLRQASKVGGRTRRPEASLLHTHAGFVSSF